MATDAHKLALYLWLAGCAGVACAVDGAATGGAASAPASGAAPSAPSAADSASSGEQKKAPSTTANTTRPPSNGSTGKEEKPPQAKPSFVENWSDTRATATKIDALLPGLEQVRIASQHDFIPSRGPFSLLVFKAFVEKDMAPASGDKTERMTYRALIVESAPGVSGASKLVAAGGLSQAIDGAAIWSERATRGTSTAPGTDFKKDELPDGKTLLHLDADVVQGSASSWFQWRRARVYVIGAAGPDGGTPRTIGSFETVISNKNWAIAISLLGCLVAYLAAACATFFVHRAQRAFKDDGTGTGSGPALVPPAPPAHSSPAPGMLDGLKASFTNRHAGQDNGHGPLVGTNYATFWSHLNPVVLSAGGNGTGSATNLQILFFSLVVFGVVSYIWLLTGQLTGLSDTVLLLMGISGLGATAAAGADLTKNRLSFDNWAWLINRSWLPPGGVAEVNVAKWKDIFTVAGAFDVYRFQMICFSVVVGIALIGAGSQLSDLSSFSVPQALLGILGLSQVVYVAGKLVAPPTISDLDAQITKLQAAEKKLRDSADVSAPSFPGANVVSWSGDAKLDAAKADHSDYLEVWQTTATMFESTLGRLVPGLAIDKRPPFRVPDVILNRLPKAAAQADYKQPLYVVGLPNAGPCTWTVSSGTFPKNMKLTAAANGIDADLSVLAVDAIAGDYRFALRVTGTSQEQTRTVELVLRFE